MAIDLDNYNFNITPDIAKEIDEAIELYDKEIIQKGFNSSNLFNLLNLLKTWKAEYVKIKNILKNYILDKRITKNKYRNYAKNGYAKKRIDNIISLYELQLKKGYAILQDIRYSLSKEATKYKILVSVEEDKIVEKEFDMNNILKSSHLNTSSVISEFQKEQENIETLKMDLHKENLQGESKTITTNTKLYQSMEYFYYHGRDGVFGKRWLKGKDDKWHRVTTKNFNRGRIYEAYKTMLNENRADENTIINNINTPYYNLLTNYFFSIRDTIKFFQHSGDVKNEELKNISYSNASLFSSNTIVRNIESLILNFEQILYNVDSLNAFQELEKLFTSNQEAANKKYNEKIKMTIRNALWQFLT